MSAAHSIVEKQMFRIMFQELPDVMTISGVCKLLGMSTNSGYKRKISPCRRGRTIQEERNDNEIEKVDVQHGQ